MSVGSVRVLRSRRNLKRKAVAYLGGKCVSCGYAKCIAALDFHHKDPSQKDFQIAGRGITRSFDKLRAELDKCELLCANCHRERHDSLVVDHPRRGRQLRDWPSKDELLKMASSMTVTEIAKVRGVSRITVRNWCRKLEVELPAHKSRERALKPTRQNPVLWPSPDYLKIMVWDRPVLLLAKELGVSEVAVKKRCKKLGIPTPPRGYWASKRYSDLAQLVVAAGC